MMTSDQMNELDYAGKLMQLFDETRDLVLHQHDEVTDTGTQLTMNKVLTDVAPLKTKRLKITTNSNQPKDKQSIIDLYVFEREDGSTGVEWYIFNAQKGAPVWSVIPSTHGMLQYVVQQMGGTGTQKPTYALGGLTTQSQWSFFTRFNPKYKKLENLQHGSTLSRIVTEVAPFRTENFIFEFKVGVKKYKVTHIAFFREDGKLKNDGKASTSSEMYFSHPEAETLFLEHWQKFQTEGQVIPIE